MFSSQEGASWLLTWGYAASKAFLLSSVSYFKYISVVVTLTCPNKSRMYIRFTPDSNRWRAFECLKWGAPHFRHYGERNKMVSGDCKPAKPPACPSIHSPFDHCLLSEPRYSIRFLSSDQSGSSLVGRMSIYASSSAFRRVSVSALA